VRLSLKIDGKFNHKTRQTEVKPLQDAQLNSRRFARLEGQEVGVYTGTGFPKLPTKPVFK
jgi:hypothetical protein